MTSDAAPVALQDNVPDDLICSICMTIPAEPLITPCDHMFCTPCIRQALNDRNLCPIDRNPCTFGQLKRLEGLSFRVWSSIQVKCGNHDSGCAWRGSVADYASHTQNCIVSRVSVEDNTATVNSLVDQLESANTDIERLENQVRHLRNNTQEQRCRINRLEVEKRALQDDIERVKSERRNLKKNLRDAEDEIDDLKGDKKSLKQSLRNRPDLPKIFHGHYDFRREDVVQLSQLISRHLEDKPDDIDSNKIFNCVRSCFTDLEKGYGDNPKHYFMDMRMLLATCLASTWFSGNQRRNIEEWNNNHFARG